MTLCNIITYFEVTMLINLLSTFFLSNKFYQAISLNKNYISSQKALIIIIIATLLDDVAYYIFDNNYALTNLSSIFYFSEVILSVFAISLLARIFGAGARASQYGSVLRAYSYTLSPVIFGSIILIIVSTTTNCNVTYYDTVKLAAFLVITGWMWLCQFICIQTIFNKLGFLKRMFLFLVTIGIYVGVDKFKKFFYLFLSGSQ